MAAHVTFERALAPVPIARKAIGALIRPTAGVAAGFLLALRYVQARVLSIWGLLIAAALCPPQAFADFAIYAALVNIVSIPALLRFEAIFFQDSDTDRLGRAFRLALATGGGFSALLCLVAAVLAATGTVQPEHALLFVLSLTGRSVIRLATAEATAAGDMRTIGNAGLVQSVVQPAAMLALILALDGSSTVLFAADALGHAVAAAYLVWRRRHAIRDLAVTAPWSREELWRSARRWHAAPRILLPSALLSFGFSVVPLAALPFTDDPIFAAQVALAMRLLDVPTQMFAAVTVPVVMSNLRIRQGVVRRRRARLLTLGLLVLAFGLFGGIAGAAFLGGSWLEATQWHGLDRVLLALAPFYAGIAMVSPLHEMGTLARAPQHPMAANAVAIVAAVAVMAWFGTVSLPMLAAIGAISLARTAVHARLTWTGIDLRQGTFGAARTSTG
ncbi:hypothetical protein ABE438_06405 [Bosea sp. TWI1241]|uniref:hypothetical protein n=1 Tax=Bosea sp. TWI1241 TaxID=3148904 RepID=UPI003207A0E9